MTTKTETWLDIDFAIPLARAVPVKVYVGCYEDWMDDVCLGRSHGGETWELAEHADEPDDSVRVDLDDPQGFGYALRWFCLQEPRALRHVKLIAQLQGKHMGRYGKYAVTDNDRLALACALRDVTK